MNLEPVILYWYPEPAKQSQSFIFFILLYCYVPLHAARVVQVLTVLSIGQFKWSLVKKASQILYLHFAVKKRAIINELHEKQEQVFLLIELAFTSFMSFLYHIFRSIQIHDVVCVYVWTSVGSFCKFSFVADFF